MTVQNPAIFIQAGSHPAEDVRRFIGATFANRGGIVAAGDLAVSQSLTPAMSVLVQGGQALVPGSEGTYQGTYFVENRGTASLAVAASDATNARRDIIVAKVQDNAYATGPSSVWSLAVVTGTPAASPADPALPANSIALARVTVAAASTTVTNASITDLRISGSLGRATALGGTIATVSTARPAAPSVGTMVYETDTGNHLVYYGATTGWRRPWGQPWGYVASTVTPPTTIQTISVFTSTKITGTDTESVTLLPTRRYRVSMFATYEHKTTAGFCYLKAETSAGAALGPAWTYAMAIGETKLVTWVSYFTGVSFTGTLQMAAQILAGTHDVNRASYGARMLVEDIGPASSSAPSI